MLCLTEKYHFIFSTKTMLNKRNELVNKSKTKTLIKYIFSVKRIAVVKGFS